jgi:adenosylmethionine-8-amino-7-oxononanoate aminotransferase
MTQPFKVILRTPDGAIYEQKVVAFDQRQALLQVFENDIANHLAEQFAIVIVEPIVTDQADAIAA